MPYANNEGVRIHYEVEGKGPPLVLMHGLTDSLEVFRLFGYVDALKSEYRLILIDARGHGASDKPHEPGAYRRATLVADVLAVLGDLGIDKAHYYGFSMGGSIAFGMARHAVNRVYSLILGDCAWTWEADPNLAARNLPRFKLDGTTDEYLQAYKALLGRWWSPGYEAIGRSNDRVALKAAMFRERFGFGEEVRHLTMPCLFTVGESGMAPEVRQYIEGMPNATLVQFPGFSHADVFARVDLVAPHIREFLAEVGED